MHVHILLTIDFRVFATNPNDISCNTVKEKKVQLHERSADMSMRCAYKYVTIDKII